MNEPTAVTRLIEQAADGDESAADRLLPLVYEQLRALAGRRMANENPGHTLQATALVHEAFMRLVGPSGASDGPRRFENQRHFYIAAGEAMRRILVDHARGKKRVKRGGAGKKVPLNVADLAASENSEEILALDDAFRRLEQTEPEAADVVRLRFFAGLSVDDTANALELSPRTVDRRWQFARAWLFRELQDDD